MAHRLSIWESDFEEQKTTRDALAVAMKDTIMLSTGARQDRAKPALSPKDSPQYQFQQQSPNNQGSNTTLVDISEETNLSDSKPSIYSPYEEIEYLYLSFDTDLPVPSLPRGSSSAKHLNLPPLPDLYPYISPFKWPSTRKSVITGIACAVTILSAAAAGCYSPPEAKLTQAWGVSGVVYNIGITVFTTGFAIAPMLLAPFSEINGRRPMFICSGALFVVCQIGCGATRSFAGMILARFFLGVGGSTFSTIVGGIISDIYHTNDRNTPMALFSTAVLFGTGFGPLFAAVVVKHTSWRWVYYSQAIAAAVLLIVVISFLKETRGSVLLSRKARVLNKWYEELEKEGCPGMDIPAFEGSGMKRCQRIRWRVKSDEERETLVKMISISLYRPFPICVGALVALLISIMQEKIAKMLGKMPTTPEGRLYFVCIESILMPAGLFWFGWTSGPSTHWIWPALAVGCATIGIFSIYLAVFNYLADTYHRYASSALAAQSCCA
ncbi:hypothetical protein PRK78_004689 [Emydomyces testavorans]|uniref:Major facilitator superfamily (MFS) profile domain-containing protein n=1 Tax=Emydomyces testavorans TaxID=2070801 RepID=A0AAF0DIF7_9EURO|nr:hypothetical protein PRK78_004689 [Emydomyces testavorans]